MGSGSGRDDGREHRRRRKGNVSVEMLGGMVGVVETRGPLTAAASRLPDRGALNFQVGLVTASCGPGAHAFLDLCSHGHESLLYIGSVLSTCLQEGDSQRVSKLLPDKKRGN